MNEQTEAEAISQRIEEIIGLINNTIEKRRKIPGIVQIDDHIMRMKRAVQEIKTLPRLKQVYQNIVIRLEDQRASDSGEEKKLITQTLSTQELKDLKERLQQLQKEKEHYPNGLLMILDQIMNAYHRNDIASDAHTFWDLIFSKLNNIDDQLPRDSSAHPKSDTSNSHSNTNINLKVNATASTQTMPAKKVLSITTHRPFSNTAPDLSKLNDAQTKIPDDTITQLALVAYILSLPNGKIELDPPGQGSASVSKKFITLIDAEGKTFVLSTAVLQEYLDQQITETKKTLYKQTTSRLYPSQQQITFSALHALSEISTDTMSEAAKRQHLTARVLEKASNIQQPISSLNPDALSKRSTKAIPPNTLRSVDNSSFETLRTAHKARYVGI